MENFQKKICWSRVLKNISYFLAPILLVILILSILALVYPYEKESMKQGKGYFETISFANEFADSIEKYLYQITVINDESNTTEDLELEYQHNYGYYNSYLVGNEINDEDIEMYCKYYNANFCYLIIDHKNNKAYTNVENRIDTNTIESIKSYIVSNDLYWKYENKETDTSIEKLKDNMNENTSLYREYLREGDYTIYTCVLGDLLYYDQYFRSFWVYTIISEVRSAAIFIIPTILVIFVVMIPTILIGIGKTKKKEGVYLNFLDKWSLGVVALLSIMIDVFGLMVCAIGVNSFSIISIIFIGVGLIIFYLSCIMMLETVVKRLKTHTFLKTTFIYWCYCKIKQIMDNMKITLKIGTLFATFVIASWLIFLLGGESFLGFMALMLFYVFSFSYILKRVIWFEKIKNTLEEIYKRKYEY